jgi:uncharacterized protein YabN with tetrapyrrole methylase and pyrophosphatase domain
MEEIIKSKGNELTQCTIEEINSNWAEAKKIT